MRFRQVHSTNLIEQALVIHILRQVRPTLLMKHRLAPALDHRFGARRLTKVHDAGVELNQASEATACVLAYLMREAISLTDEGGDQPD